MNLTIAVTPSGKLSLSESTGPEARQNRICEAFAESSAAGLLALAAGDSDAELSAEVTYWRGFSRELLQSLGQQGDSDISNWPTLPEPSDEEFAAKVAEAPPMRGLEYLTTAALKRLRQEFLDLAAARAQAFPEGPAEWLRSVHPLLRSVGKVTFHLAENKRDPARPFAFLATFAHRLSGRDRLQHLPLGEAVKTYAGARDRAKLAVLLEPVRRAAEASRVVRELLESKALFAPQAWTIGQAYGFLKEVPAIEQAGVVVRVPDWWSAKRPPRPKVQVRLGKSPESGLSLDAMLEFEVEVALDGEPLTAAERKQLLAASAGLVFLRGQWVEVDGDRLKEALEHWKKLDREHARGMDFIHGMRLLAGVGVEANAEVSESVAEWSRVVAGDGLKQTLERLRRPETIEACQPGRDLKATLRPYQVDGVRWLWLVTELGLGGCLADDMGLGKTVQIIDLLLLRKRNRKLARPALLIVPASLLGNWKRELSRFAPTLQVFFAHRSETSGEELDRVAQDPEQSLAPYDLVATTYGLARRQPWLEKSSWSLVILDEAQAIKNAGSAQTRAVKKLAAPCRLVLTGTPVENNVGDLWSLFDFCCPGLLGGGAEFKRYVKRLQERQESRAFASLRRLVQPYILRRLKTDPNIAPDLPEKTEMLAECGLAKRQAVLYEKAVHDVQKRLQTADGIARRGLVLSLLMQLKQICNHPDLFLGGHDFAADDSGKFARLRLLCEPIVERQEKLLLFTQFQSMTEPLANFLAEVFGRLGVVLHGGTPIGKRTEMVQAFQSEAGPPFFVISLKAGGSGLNLTAGNHVIHFDRWWNPAVENQATDRAFRLGQKRNVIVHKFVCRGTVEERIDAMIQSKQALADQLLQGEAEQALTEMNDEELLRFVALDLGRATSDE